MSDPPAVKLIAARGVAWQMVISQLSELVGLAVVGHALEAGKLSSTEFMGCFMFCLGGNAIGKIRGKVPVPMTSAVVGLAVAAPAALKSAGAAALAKHILGTVVLGVLLVGCGIFSSHEPDWVQVRNNANAMRADVNAVAAEVTPLAPLINATCNIRGDNSKECVALEDGYEVARQAVVVARQVIEMYDETAMGADSVSKAVKAVHAAAQQVSEAARAAVGAISDVVANQSAQPGEASPGDGAADAGAAPAQDPGRTVPASSEAAPAGAQ